MDPRRIASLVARITGTGRRPLRVAFALVLVHLFAVQVMLAPAAHAAKSDPFAIVWCAEKASVDPSGDRHDGGADACCMLGCSAAPVAPWHAEVRTTERIVVAASTASATPNARDDLFPPAAASVPRAPPSARS